MIKLYNSNEYAVQMKVEGSEYQLPPRSIQELNCKEPEKVKLPLGIQRIEENKK